MAPRSCTKLLWDLAIDIASVGSSVVLDWSFLEPRVFGTRAGEPNAGAVALCAALSCRAAPPAWDRETAGRRLT